MNNNKYSEVYGGYVRLAINKSAGTVGIALVILIHLSLACLIVKGGDNTQPSKVNVIPWGEVLQKYAENAAFCINLIPGSNSESAYNGEMPQGIMSYVFATNEPVCIKLPEAVKEGEPRNKIAINIMKYSEGFWIDSGKTIGIKNPGEINLTGGLAESGFFRLTLPGLIRGYDYQIYVIVCDNWKNELLALCRGLKGEIETNSDQKLIFSGIAVSHFDKTMEKISKSQILTSEIMEGMADAVRNKKVFESGQCPDFVKGVNKFRLRRFPGAKISEFVVKLPQDYEDSRKWPIILNTNPKGRIESEEYPGYIYIVWHFDSYYGFEWKDYKYVFSVIRNKLSIDEDRIYLYGLCGNGVPATALSFLYPDEWAETVAILGTGYRHLAGNALNLPYIFIKGGHSEDEMRSSYDFSLKNFLYNGLKDLKHSQDKGDEAAIVRELRGKQWPEAVRQRSPKHIYYKIESPRNSKTYWVNILGREDENLIGTIDISVEGQKIYVETDNIAAYCLDLEQAPVDSNMPSEIFENSLFLGLSTGRYFYREPENITAKDVRKNSNICGPISDIFTDPYIVVYPSRFKNSEMCQLARRTAEALASGAPCVSDVDISSEYISSHNLVIIGSEELNGFVSEISDKIPVRIDDGAIKAGDREFNGRDRGYIIIYPNPLNKEKYVLVMSAASTRGMENIFKAYSELISSHPCDVGIFEVGQDNTIMWHVMEKFNMYWEWQDDWDEILLRTEKAHSEWRWKQLAAKVVREQLEADAAIVPDPLRSVKTASLNIIPDSGSFHDWTYRDINNVFKDQWLVKIELKGELLRKLAALTFSEDTGQKTNGYFLDGITFSKQYSDSNDILCINELDDEKSYTLVCTRDYIVRQRLGVNSRDYEIIGEGFLLTLLRQYLVKNRGINMDLLLEKMKMNF